MKDKDNSPALEVKEDGQIWLIPECPVEPNVQHSAFYPDYEKAIASAERILVSNQEVAKGIIWKDKAGLPVPGKEYYIKPGIYPIPDLKWKRKKNWVSGDADNKWFEDTAVISLPESKTVEYQEEILADLFSQYFKMLHEGKSMYVAVKILRDKFTITRKP